MTGGRGGGVRRHSGIGRDFFLVLFLRGFGYVVVLGGLSACQDFENVCDSLGLRSYAQRGVETTGGVTIWESATTIMTIYDMENVSQLG